MKVMVLIKVMTTMTTITISEEAKRELLKIAAELQAKSGERVDYEGVIRFLVSKARRDVQLFLEACSPLGIESKVLRRELQKGRAEDRRREKDLEKRHS